MPDVVRQRVAMSGVSPDEVFIEIGTTFAHMDEAVITARRGWQQATVAERRLMLRDIRYHWRKLMAKIDYRPSN